VSFDQAKVNAIILEHGSIHRVVIAAVKGSSPREVGAAMLLWEGGQSGSIGGGALEYQAAQDPKTGVRSYPLGPELGQCCGGHVTLVTEYFDSTLKDAQLFIRRVAGTEELPLVIIRQQREARNGGAPGSFEFTKGWLVEPVNPPRTPLWVWGAGHVGRAVVQIASQLEEFDITWVDTSSERFPFDIPFNVTVVPAVEPAHLMAHAPKEAQHLIFTYSHALDLTLCDAALNRGFAFCGLIGSKSKWARFKGRLSALGHSDRRISDITCPIGEPNLGKQPIAIAIGVTQSLLSAEIRSTDQRSACL
jgi:xanthine dehydrogenase accessory factor